jgi:hypothetical protein
MASSAVERAVSLLSTLLSGTPVELSYVQSPKMAPLERVAALAALRAGRSDEALERLPLPVVLPLSGLKALPAARTCRALATENLLAGLSEYYARGAETLLAEIETVRASAPPDLAPVFAIVRAVLNCPYYKGTAAIGRAHARAGCEQKGEAACVKCREIAAELAEYRRAGRPATPAAVVAAETDVVAAPAPAPAPEPAAPEPAAELAAAPAAAPAPAPAAPEPAAPEPAAELAAAPEPAAPEPAAPEPAAELAAAPESAAALRADAPPPHPFAAPRYCDVRSAEDECRYHLYVHIQMLHLGCQKRPFLDLRRCTRLAPGVVPAGHLRLWTAGEAAFVDPRTSVEYVAVVLEERGGLAAEEAAGDYGVMAPFLVPLDIFHVSGTGAPAPPARGVPIARDAKYFEPITRRAYRFAPAPRDPVFNPAGALLMLALAEEPAPAEIGGQVLARCPPSVRAVFASEAAARAVCKYCRAFANVELERHGGAPRVTAFFCKNCLALVAQSGDPAYACATGGCSGVRLLNALAAPVYSVCKACYAESQLAALRLADARAPSPGTYALPPRIEYALNLLSHCLCRHCLAGENAVVGADGGLVRYFCMRCFEAILRSEVPGGLTWRCEECQVNTVFTSPLLERVAPLCRTCDQARKKHAPAWPQRGSRGARGSRGSRGARGARDACGKY